MIIGEPTYSENDFLAAIPADGKPCNTAHIIAQVGCARNTAIVWLDRLVACGKIVKIEILGGSPVWKRPPGNQVDDPNYDDPNYEKTLKFKDVSGRLTKLNTDNIKLNTDNIEEWKNDVLRALAYFEVNLEVNINEETVRALAGRMADILRCVAEAADTSEVNIKIAAFREEVHDVYFNRCGAGWSREQLLHGYEDARLAIPKRRVETR